MQRLRVVGGLANLTQYTLYEEPFWSKEFAKLTGGKVIAEVAPFDQSGIRGQEMLRLMQVGAVPFGTMLLSRIATGEPALSAGDLAGLNPDMKTLRKNVAAYRPMLEKILRERHNIELLAIYTYPAQVMFCTKAFNGLSDLAGRKIRTAGLTQSDLMRALGAVPVQTEFAEIVPAVRSGNVECVITGAQAGNTIGLHEVTTHIGKTAFTWGLSVFGANVAAWNAQPQWLKESLRTALPRLERAIWDVAERETVEGLGCNTGAATCTLGRKGRMVEVTYPAADALRLRELFASHVLPRWVERCGPQCLGLWNQSLAPATGIEARLK